MCGFVGYARESSSLENFRSDSEEQNLFTWGQSIGHRGPDQAGTAQHPPFGLSTRRLSILDLSELGNQPMESPRYILGFNGEIYNHLEVRRELIRSGYTFRSDSDTETVLWACEHWGVTGALERFNGMFAIALWDKREEALTLARDPLGVKPLYFLLREDGLYFASELKALRPYASGWVSPEATALFFYFGFVPAPYCLLDGVQKVRAGECVIYSRGYLRRNHFIPKVWGESARTPEHRDTTPEALRGQIEGAIARQLLADVPVGVFLSGGVDSSILAAVSARLHPNLASFSLRPEEATLEPGAVRDAEIAARYAAHLGLRHHEVSIEPKDFVCTVETLPHLMDEPSCEPYVLAEVLLSRAARRAGVTVVLTGHGADEVFLGYPSYRAVLQGTHYDRIPQLGPIAKAVSKASFVPPRHASNLAGLASVWRQTSLERYATVSAVTFDPVTTRCFGLSDAAVMELVSEVIANANASLGDLPRGHDLSPVERFARLDLRLKVPEHYNTRLDKASMSASVEARVPFQDLELIAFVAGLEDKTLLRGGLKGLLREAFRHELPPEIVRRPKQTFQAPILSWMRGPLAEWAGSKLTALPDLPNGLDDLSACTTSRQATILWNLAALESWREAFGLSYK
jgi:asparagine synthase (glutamine-hydrolysing)